MRKAYQLCCGTQGDQPKVAAEIILLLSLVKMNYEDDDEYEVVEISQSWTARKPFNYLPCFIMTTNAEKETDDMPLM